VTPGEGELAANELRQADEALKSARLLIGAGQLISGTSRLYYAAFHAARAAVSIKGLYSKTHSGLIGLYGEAFGPASLLQELFRLRQLADYSRQPVEFSPKDLAPKVEETALFVQHCGEIVSEALKKGADETDPPADL